MWPLHPWVCACILPIPPPLGSNRCPEFCIHHSLTLLLSYTSACLSTVHLRFGVSWAVHRGNQGHSLYDSPSPRAHPAVLLSMPWFLSSPSGMGSRCGTRTEFNPSFLLLMDTLTDSRFVWFAFLSGTECSQSLVGEFLRRTAYTPGVWLWACECVFNFTRRCHPVLRVVAHWQGRDGCSASYSTLVIRALRFFLV